MSGYLLSVIGVILLTSLLTVVIPQGKTSKIVAAISKLACIVAILMPIPSLLKGEETDFFGETIIETDEAYIKYCSEMRVREAEYNLQKQLREQYSERLDFSLYWGWEEENEPVIRVYRADIFCEELTEEERQSISVFLTETYGIEAAFYGKC